MSAPHVILVVDDDPAFRAYLAALLRARGYTVLDAERPSDARRLLKSESIDLLIVDGELPEQSGVDFIAELRADGDTTRVMFLSAFWRDRETFERLTNELRVSRVLHKPVRDKELLVQVEGCFAERAAASRSTQPAPATVSPVSRVKDALSALRQRYAGELVTQLHELAALLSAGETGGGEARMRAQRLAHRIHGTAGTYGFHAAGSAAGTAENILRQIHERGMDAAFAPWGRLRAGVAGALSGLGADAGPDFAHESPGMRLPTLLVIDADQATLTRALELGRMKLVDVVGASTTEVGLELAEQHRPDAALIGLELGPGEDAFRTAGLLRGLDGLARLPLGFLSGELDLSRRVAAVHAGGSVFVDKPLDGDALQDAVRHLVAFSEAAQPRILIVDDDPQFCEAVAAMLTAERMHVTALNEPIRVMEVIEQVRPEALLVDLDMPGLSGFDVCKVIRASSAWRDIPVLFATSRRGPDVRLACFECGGDDYIEKPVLRDELLARLCARLTRVRLHRELADRDSLTGLLRRHAFTKAARVVLAAAKRSSRPSTLALLDLDGFKGINDTHGHPVGDQVLARLGRLLATRFRAEDVRCRWAGDEFALAFGGAGRDQIDPVMRATLAEFREETFENAAGEPFTATFTAGVACFPEDGDSLEELVRKADERLYEAKKAGRNRVYP